MLLGRNFTAIVYPESAVEGWRDILKELHISFLVSPLHDLDLNDDGQPKKAHYHIMLFFEGNKSDKQIIDIFDSIGAVYTRKTMVVNSKRNMARYMCHLDEDDKPIYDTSAVYTYGVDYIQLVNAPSDKYIILDEIQEFCDRYDIISFYVLMKYCKAYRPDWAIVIRDMSTIYIDNWLKSRKWSKENNVDKLVDPITGEVIDL